MYDKQQSTGLPDRPALQKWWILMCHHMEMETLTYRKMERGNGANNDPQIYQRRFKVGKRDVSINGHVLPVPRTCALQHPLLRTLLLCRGQCFRYMQRKETKSVLLSFLSIFLPLFFSRTPCIWKQLSRGKGFSYFCLSRHVNFLGVSALFSGARNFSAANEDQNPSSRLNY